MDITQRDREIGEVARQRDYINQTCSPVYVGARLENAFIDGAVWADSHPQKDEHTINLLKGMYNTIDEMYTKLTMLRASLSTLIGDLNDVGKQDSH